VSLFEREIRVRLSSPALEILFDAAGVLSEGCIEGDGYFGSTMITIDLRTVAALVSEGCDAAVARRLAELVAADRRVRQRAQAIAIAEASDRIAGELRSPQVDIRVRSTGVHLHIDVDLEAGIVRRAHV
jgi:hypothetical protein